MFTEQTYRCKCHVCGTEYNHQTVFMSSPIMLASDDGQRALPARSCGAHAPEEIRAAYDRITGADRPPRTRQVTGR